MEPGLQKDAFIARTKGTRLAQQDDPHVIKKAADGTGCVTSIHRCMTLENEGLRATWTIELVVHVTAKSTN